MGSGVKYSQEFRDDKGHHTPRGPARLRCQNVGGATFYAFVLGEYARNIIDANQSTAEITWSNNTHTKSKIATRTPTRRMTLSRIIDLALTGTYDNSGTRPGKVTAMMKDLKLRWWLMLAAVACAILTGCRLEEEFLAVAVENKCGETISMRVAESWHTLEEGNPKGCCAGWC